MLSFQKILPSNHRLMNLIAGWYKHEWNIPEETTLQKLTAFPGTGFPFHYLLYDKDEPVATGGLHTHVGLLTTHPEFAIYGPWLALIYTPPEHRNRGHASFLCQKIEAEAKAMGVETIYLFTYTAEALYARQGWTVVKRFEYKGHDTVVMLKRL